MRIKRILSILIAAVFVLLLLPQNAILADNPSGECGEDLTWEFDDASSTLTIKGTGKMFDYRNDDSFFYAPWNDYKDNIRVVKIEEGVSSIGKYAFYESDMIEEISLPSTLTAIGSYAFGYDVGIKEIVIPNSVKTIGDSAFLKCTALTKITLPSGLTVIEAGLLDGCSALTDLKLPAGIQRIGRCAFSFCEGITELVLPEHLVSIKEEAFARSGLTSITIPDKTTEVDPTAFDHCEDLSAIIVSDSNPVYASENGLFLTKNKKTLLKCPAGREIVQIPSTVETIGEAAFLECVNIQKITLPKKVAVIEAEAFKDCTGLNGVIWSEQLKTIGSRAFENCTSLKDVILPDQVETIGFSAFNNCTGMTKIVIPASVVELGSEIFYFCNSLKTAEIKGKIETLPEYTFCYCDHLTEVKLPSSLKNIGDCAFYGCTKLKKVKLPTGMKTLGTYAFSLCSSLKSIDIPAGVKVIPYGCFANCTKLSSITIPASLTEWYITAFSYTAMKNVYYMGTAKSWKRISINEENNDEDEEDDWDDDWDDWDDAAVYAATVRSALIKEKPEPLSFPEKGEDGYVDLTDCTLHYLNVSDLTVKNTKDGMKLSWKTGEEGTKVRVYRKVGSGDWKKLATVKAGTTDFTDKKASKQGKQYSYRIEAYRGTSADKKTKAVTLYRLKTPAISSAVGGTGKITVRWKKHSKVTGYQIKYVIGKTKKTVTIKGANTVRKVLTELRSGKTYKVYLRTFKKVKGKKYYSAWSTVKKVKTA